MNHAELLAARLEVGGKGPNAPPTTEDVTIRAAPPRQQRNLPKNMPLSRRMSFTRKAYGGLLSRLPLPSSVA